MINRLTPEQISNFWNIIKYALEQFPPESIEVSKPDWISGILTSALSGDIEVWASYDKNEEEKKIRLKGIVLTSFSIDNFIREKNLLIYYVYSFDNPSIRMWIEGLKTLSMYARFRGCSRICAYSSNEEILELTDKLKGNTNVRFITFNLED